MRNTVIATKLERGHSALIALIRYQIWIGLNQWKIRLLRKRDLNPAKLDEIVANTHSKMKFFISEYIKHEDLTDCEIGIQLV
jgi:hypothetical protein